MIEATVARPYAKALYSLAQKHNTLEPWLEKLAVLAEISLIPKIQALLTMPKLGKYRKLEIFCELVGEDHLDPMLKNFLVLLVDNNRLELMSVIYESYKLMVLEVEKIEQAVVYSAYSLTDDELSDLLSSVEKHCGVKLAATLVVKPELIGGFKVEFGDQVLDMSVKSELDSLYQTMIS